MSVSKEERKARTKAKNTLNSELSLIQLLYLVKEYNLENEVNIDGGIYEHKVADFLSENIDIDDIDNIIEKANSINQDLLDLEFELRLISKKELKHVLRDVDRHIPSSFDFLVNSVFLFISLDDIRVELDNLIPVKKEGGKEVGSGEGESVVVDEPVDETPAGAKPCVEAPASADLGAEEEPVDKVPEDKGPVEEPAADEEPIEVISFELNQDNVKSKLEEYDIAFLADIILNNFNLIAGTGLSEEEILDVKDLHYELEGLSEEEQNERLADEKERLIDIILQNIPTDILNEEYFNPVVYEFFPYGKSFKEARSYQVETISQIYNAIEKGYKYIFLEACSGFGKSLIAATLSRIYSEGKSYILTPTNQLLTPYEEVFKDFSLKKVKARKFSTCKRNRKYCSYAFCHDDDCRYFKNLNLNRELSPRNTCEYLYQLNQGLESDAIVCTYDYFFTEAFRKRNFLGKRKLIICDEGHNIDNLASSGSTLMLYENTLSKIGLDTEQEHGDIEETEDYYFFLLKAKQYYEEFLDRNPYMDTDDKRIIEKDLFKLTNFLSYFEDGDNNITFDYIEGYNDNHRWIFSPINTKQFVRDVLFEYSDVCIFMSSSIFDYENFAFDLGIEEDDVFKLRIPPIFDLSNNPIKVYNKFDMSRESLKEIRYNTLPIVDEILEKHKFEKGIIHAFSNECKDFLFENLTNKRRLITHTTEDRERKLEEFKNSPRKLVFVSSSMDEGVDLPGDLCRFQILYKLPYPSSEDERVQVREKTYEDGTDWYVYKMLTRLIQAYGRGIRFEGDYCTTYLLDNRIWDVVDEDYDGSRIIPQYFLDVLEEYDRFEEIENIPEEDGEDELDKYLSQYL